MGTAIRYTDTITPPAPQRMTLAAYLSADFSRAKYRAYLDEQDIKKNVHIVQVSRRYDAFIAAITLSNGLMFMFVNDDLQSPVYLVPIEDALPSAWDTDSETEDDLGAPDGWYDEDDGEDEPTGYMQPCHLCGGTGARKDRIDDYVKTCEGCQGTGIHMAEVGEDADSEAFDISPKAHYAALEQGIADHFWKVQPDDLREIEKAEDADADRDCAHMLRTSIVDFMAMAEAFDLIESGLNIARAYETNVTRWQARHARLRILCNLLDGETWREAQARYQMESV